MTEYWAVIGRMMIDHPFHQQLIANYRHNEQDTSKLTNLFSLLARTYGLRLSLWELGDINRILTQLKAAEDEIQDVNLRPSNQVKLHWNSAKAAADPQKVLDGKDSFEGRILEMWAVLGLASMDQRFAQRVVGPKGGKTRKEHLRAELQVPPVFRIPDSEEFDTLVIFCDIPQIADVLDQLHDINWVVPKSARKPLMGLFGAETEPLSVGYESLCAGSHHPHPMPGKKPYIHMAPSSVEKIAQFLAQAESPILSYL